MAAAWGSCFGSAYAAAARGTGVDPAPELSVQVTLGVDAGVYTITDAVLTVQVGEGQSREEVQAIADSAHARCPVSKVFAGGIAHCSVRVGGAE